MTYQITACRLVMFGGLAAVALSGTISAPARADDHDNRIRYEARQEQVHRQERWQAAHRYNDYYRRPDVYYSAPPVVYAPPGYYQQPGASLNFSFPFYR